MNNDWWRGAVIYQIYPRSFQDDSGDGVGDLAGIIRRLPYVASLGVDAIWLSPIYTSPMADMGYDVSDYRGIDPVFGTMADFDRLVARAHDLGLKVILDQVISHTSDRHPWFADARKRGAKYDWYVWADPNPDGTPPNNWLSVFGGPAWEWEAGRRQFYLHNFLASQPDLNFHNPAVQDEMLDVLRFWLDRGVDGFRLDTVNYYFHDPELRPNPPAMPRKDGRPQPAPYDMQLHLHDKTRPENLPFLARMRQLLNRYDARCLVGEVGDAPGRALKIMAEYTSGPDHLHMAYSFDMLGPDYTPEHFRACIDSFFAAAPDGWPSWAFSNHDVIRHVTRWEKDGASPQALAKQAIALLASFPGTISLYQGEELGQTQTEMAYHELTDPPGLRFWPEDKGRDGCRTPMVWETDAPNAGFSAARPWLPVKAPQAARAVAAQETDPGSVLAQYRKVLAFRRASAALRTGDIRFLDLPAPILGFVRTGETERLTCLFNLSPEPRTIAAAPDGIAVGPGADPDAGRSAGNSLTLPANGWLWLKTT